MITSDLLALGLSQKEAEVYLAALQLGYANVQKIASKAEINRTTAYTQIHNLISRGLMNSMERNGKIYLIAEKPDVLRSFCEKQEQEIRRRRETVEKLMPELELLYNVASNRPSVRIYPLEQLTAIREEILFKRSDELLNLFNYEVFKDYINRRYIENLLDSTKSFKALYISRAPFLDRRLTAFGDHEKLEWRHLPHDKFNLVCELLIADNRVYITRDKEVLIMDDQLFAQTLRVVFNALWGLGQKIIRE